ncbi:hypothetical protein ACFL44_01915, partial [Gemmatimonadota bacterium]
VSQTGYAMGTLVLRCCENLNMPPDSELPISFMGTLASTWASRIEEPVRESAGRYGTSLTFIPPRMPAEGGAALLAFEAAGITLGEEGREKLTAQIADRADKQ